MELVTLTLDQWQAMLAHLICYLTYLAEPAVLLRAHLHAAPAVAEAVQQHAHLPDAFAAVAAAQRHAWLLDAPAAVAAVQQRAQQRAAPAVATAPLGRDWLLVARAAVCCGSCALACLAAGSACCCLDACRCLAASSAVSWAACRRCFLVVHWSSTLSAGTPGGMEQQSPRLTDGVSPKVPGT